MLAMNIANMARAKIVAELRIKEALRARQNPAADYVISFGDLVRVYRETNKRLLGAYKVIRVEGKQILIDRDGSLVQYNIAQVLPDRIWTGEKTLEELREDLSQFAQSSGGNPSTATN